ncbi:septum site-determining protein MinC [Halobacillus sp. A5]|uniref:septum site-determining protein MinC n=1 Tax=Halobacillus sp. A5 TaxID=2880263 RepID=UPI0020A6D610|nr:septum site-determining protein MinC [Halobacillus sp. A5]MCP3025539.1 septum site-determining protein MinC [Halobacillus sp. A5]
MSANSQLVTIKGTRDGLTLWLNDQCSYDSILQELEEKLSVNGVDDDQPMIRVTIQLGNRFLTDDQQDKLREIVREKQKLVVEKIESNVMTKDEALSWKENTEITPITKTVRSGQVVEIKGDLLLLGDVNPGGKVVASGNIFILGHLRGIAHAGASGNEGAVIAASYMKPNQLRIGSQISRAPDQDSDGLYIECGYVDEKNEAIRIAPLQEVMKQKPDLVSFERRMLNG